MMILIIKTPTTKNKIIMLIFADERYSLFE